MTNNYLAQFGLFMLGLLISSTIHSQEDCDLPSGSALLNVNNVSTSIFSGESPWSGGSEAQYLVPADGSAKPFYSSYFFIGGLSPDNQLSFAQGNQDESNSDFYAGPLDNLSGELVANACADFNDPIVVYEYQSLMHKAYFDCVYDLNCVVQEEFPFYTIPDELINYPAQISGNSNQLMDLLPFFDADSDGSYDATQGDYPLFSSMSNEQDCEECETLKGHQAVITISNDVAGDHLASGGNSLGIEVINVHYAFSTSDVLDDVTFVQKKITNKGTMSFENSFLGYFVDFDLGNPFDDYVGHDVARNLSYVYNGDPTDESGFTPGYGENPPAFGFALLKGPEDELQEQIGTTAFIVPNGTSGILGTPVTESDHYNYSIGRDLSSNPIVCPEGYPTPFMNSGDSYPNQDCNGWNELELSNAPGDRKAMISSSNFEFNPGTVQCISYALIHSQGQEGQESATLTLKEHADEVQNQFNACFDCLAPKADLQVIDYGNGNYQFYNHNNNGDLVWTINGEQTGALFPSTHVEEGQALNVSLEISNECGEDTQFLVFQDGALSVTSDETSNIIQLSLNNRQLGYTFPEPLDCELILLDMSGRIIAQKAIFNTGSMDLSNFTHGIYLAQVRAKDGSLLKVEKFKL